MSDELTIEQAADLLDVSRPYVIRLLDEKKLPHRGGGDSRQVRLADLLAFERRDDAERDATTAELTAEAERLGLGC